MGFDESSRVAKRGGGVAGVAREKAEKELGASIISSKNAKNTLIDFSKEHLEFKGKEIKNND